jgi:hypothetical protein
MAYSVPSSFLLSVPIGCFSGSVFMLSKVLLNKLLDDGGHILVL